MLLNFKSLDGLALHFRLVAAQRLASVLLQHTFWLLRVVFLLLSRDGRGLLLRQGWRRRVRVEGSEAYLGFRGEIDNLEEVLPHFLDHFIVAAMAEPNLEFVDVLDCGVDQDSGHFVGQLKLLTDQPE